MVTVMRKTLNEAGVDDDNIQTENFQGTEPGVKDRDEHQDKKSV